MSSDSFGTQSTMTVGDRSFTIFKLAELEKQFPQAKTLPFSLKILLENLLRRENGLFVSKKDNRLSKLGCDRRAVEFGDPTPVDTRPFRPQICGSLCCVQSRFDNAGVSK